MFFKNYKLKGFSKEDFSFLKLNSNEVEFPIGNKHPGSFGFKRKNHIHEGIDLYCKENDEVLSLTNGIIVDINYFTGDKVNSPWWNETSYIAIEYDDLVIVYGELKVNDKINIGDKIYKNDVIGNIIPVLKNKKNNRPINMLHLELYDKKLYTEPKEWIDKKPLGLLNPIKLLKTIMLK